MTKAVLLLECPDRKGLVAAIMNFLVAEYDANILHAGQHQDAELGRFFMRVEFECEDHLLHERVFEQRFTRIADEYRMRWQLAESHRRLRVCLFVSQHLHCLADLLQRHKAGELECEIALVIGNHPDGEALTNFYGIPFYTLPVRGNKAAVEEEQQRLLREHRVDLVVLARYMQILSSEFVEQWPARIINVHHSFLPAFIGSKPYHAAFARGVKLIGATSHYVTADLDEGPIIDQDVTRVTQGDTIPDLIRKGRDLERVVLSRAVRWHLEHRILHYDNKTVIFD
ncbi:formyltetrahydrofolate deformylase [Silvibacterium dinghuense]|uniref:Formyltetrahydrofolate deformylase n=1 Tax=Silvibacterium dinghuense TaxID=1560006 RepID=A0A4Q1SA16_9BACT|nr:formyltetrahydrofolate deformylase [Silvibacterium dinghuense]RXS93775.1 formyltetrahydrofolate deformylase [Silvibacterium dinghuense]GGH07502.1 formyltetrahydrofolate deformylase [Silvibacterium dinghuense]